MRKETRKGNKKRTKEKVKIDMKNQKRVEGEENKLRESKIFRKKSQDQ